MCGIVGVVSKHTNGLSNPEIDMFENMLFVDTMRGWDSTGVFGVDHLGNVGIAKAAMHGPDFICTDEFKVFKRAAVKDGVFVVGHNRAATRGSVTDDNAHPFYVDDKVVLVQNGSWKGSHKHIKDVEVDSHAIAHLLADNADVEDAMKQVNAAYALVWYNVETEELCLLRNHERPLYIAEFMHSGFMFASEVETIMYAAAKSNSPKFKKDPYQLPVNTLMTVKFTRQGAEVTTKEINPYPKSNVFTDVTAWRELKHRSLEHTFANAYAGCYEDVEIDPVGSTVESPGRLTYTNNNHGYSCKPQDISIMVAELLRQKGQAYWYETEQDAIAGAEALRDCIQVAKSSAHKKIFLSMLDCEAANTHEDCSTWHMLGTIEQGEATNTPKPIVHFVLYGKTMLEAINIACGYCEVEAATVVTETFLTDEGRRWIVRAYGFNPEVLEVQ